MTLTASGVPRAMLCPPSAVLPHIETTNAHAEAGTARHRYLERYLAIGAAALDEVPEEHREDCASLPVAELPASQRGLWAAEVAFAYSVTTDEGEAVGISIARAYPVEEFRGLGPIIFGTADVVGLTHDEVIVIDYKGPHDRADHTWQLKTLLVAACRAYNRPRGRAATISLRGEERPYWRWIELDEFALEEAAEALRELVAVRIPGPPRYRIGAHCDRCPAFAFCPAQARLAVALARGEEQDALATLLPLDEHTLPVAWEKLRAARKLLARIDDACHAAAIDMHRRGIPVRLSDGRRLGPVETSRESLDGLTTYHVLQQLHGQEIAEGAVEFAASKASIDRSLRGLLRSPKDRLAPLRRSALDAIRAAGGVTVRTTTTIREYEADGPPAQLGDGEETA